MRRPDARAGLVLPAALFMGLLYLLPVLSLLWGSVQTDAGLSLAGYRQFLGEDYAWTLLARTVLLSLAAVLASLALAFPVALYLRRLSVRWRTVLAVLLLSPLLTSVVVRTLAWVILLGQQGVVNAGLQALGLPALALIYNDAGVVIGLVHVYFGYMLLCLLTSVLKVDPAQWLAAANLGAGPWRRWWSVILPQCWPGVAAGAALVFAQCASAYVTPVLLGGTRTKVLATEVYDLAMTYLDWHGAAVAAVVLFGATWLFVSLMSLPARRRARQPA